MARSWIESQACKVVNIETVVLPNIWREEGTTDVKRTVDATNHTASNWYQFIRVGYKVS